MYKRQPLAYPKFVSSGLPGQVRPAVLVTVTSMPSLLESIFAPRGGARTAETYTVDLSSRLSL